MMSQGVLGFKYERGERETGLTALGGLPLYLELAVVIGLGKSIQRHVGVRAGVQGWSDVQVILALILMNLAGGEHVEDLKQLEADEGFCQVLKRVELAGLPRKVRRELERRWRKERQRTVPSPSAVFRYLAGFNDPSQEGQREKGKAWIPAPHPHLKGLGRVNQDLVAAVQRKHPEQVATLDQDATLVETSKEGALYSYQHFKAYQPLNTYWAEPGLVLHTEFRDGNVPAGHEQLRVLKAALAMLPAGVERVRLRSDTAGYQQELLRYCAEGKNERFGRIEFAISCDVTREFRDAVEEVGERDWQPLLREINGEPVQTGQEWAEVCFVPNWVGHSKRGAAYRYLAIREPLRQLALPGMENRELPFPTVEMKRQRYKVFGIVTNLDWEGGRLIHWQHERCGKSEEVHQVMKEDLAGGTLPSADFGENAAWWWIMILAFNLNAALKRLVLGQEWAPKRMKAMRFGLIHLPGRVIAHARQLVVRLSQKCRAYDWIVEARAQLQQWALLPSG